MNKLRTLSQALIALQSVMAYAAGASDVAMQRSSKVANQMCISCHGPDGQSTNSRFPILAGQHAEFLENQLRDFRGHERAEPDAHDFIWGIAAHLDDDLIASLASYFQSQTPVHGKPDDQKLTKLGNDIFHNGIPARGVTACVTCHGETGQGAGLVPRLAGQHREYVQNQLQLIQSSARDVPAMHSVVKELKPEEIQAIATYLHAL